ncbi:aminodeoxychorismate synthase component I [Rhizobium sp. TRM95796]|uniref:aminodeoxychorismate synthase component I n=1 Tax=Rhizobium sp. TRM95796 TaxID=2979862 RepID=UPI0021E7CA05|nr:aminodeoxychorismate synthase component I [Rhizobium sp. TRM95796]MCV3766105.1 aminodeoxychorismate synthase component I [Rhizobium sp. TRM95796]
MAPADPFILLRDDRRNETLFFAEPEQLILAHDAAALDRGFERLETARRNGKWIAGFMSYEAGYLFEKRLARYAGQNRTTPLMAFGVFDAPKPNHPLARPRQRLDNEEFLQEPRAEWPFGTYQERFNRLHRHLRQGDCYQGNLTMPVRARWTGDPLAAFWSLIERQPVHYGALVNLGGPMLLSRSPELFFKVDEDGWIETHPMKGTAARGASPAEDEAIKAAMIGDEKTQAENRMIVDLLRNDISRISEVGTLDVPKLFHIETYPTVHQMVSHVRAKLLPDLTLRDIFSALFPCGSVTGAPKMRAMEILHEIEAGPRDAYCGSIGFVAPDGQMCFNVAIRTISLFDDGEAVFNVGGGIVFDSNAEDEYAECLLKARFALGAREIAR